MVSMWGIYTYICVLWTHLWFCIQSWLCILLQNKGLHLCIIYFQQDGLKINANIDLRWMATLCRFSIFFLKERQLLWLPFGSYQPRLVRKGLYSTRKEFPSPFLSELTPVNKESQNIFERVTSPASLSIPFKFVKSMVRVKQLLSQATLELLWKIAHYQFISWIPRLCNIYKPYKFEEVTG